MITISALVQAKRPVRNLRRRTHDLGILPCDFSRVGLASSQKIKVQDAPDHVVLQCGRARLCVVDFHVHAVRIEQENAVRARLAMLKVHGMITVEVGVWRDSERIARPEGARELVSREAERVAVLPETVYVGACGQSGFETEVLRFENEWMRRCGEEYFRGRRSGYIKRERGCSVTEANGGSVGRGQGARRRTWKDRVGYFVPSIICICDFEMYARC